MADKTPRPRNPHPHMVNDPTIEVHIEAERQLVYLFALIWGDHYLPDARHYAEAQLLAEQVVSQAVDAWIDGDDGLRRYGVSEGDIAARTAKLEAERAAKHAA